MTKKELMRLYYLNREIENDKARLEEIKAFATGVTSRITGLPHASGITDKTALAAEIADLEAAIEEKCLRTIREYTNINIWAGEIEDNIMRQVIPLKYASGLTWHQVAQHISECPETGEPYSADALRMKTRYFLNRAIG